MKLADVAKALERFKFTAPVESDDISTVHAFLRKTFPGVSFEVFFPIDHIVKVRVYVKHNDYAEVNCPVIASPSKLASLSV